MRYLNPIFCIVLFISSFLSTNTPGQQNQAVIEGRVLERATGAPLENVNVYISGTTWGTATDRNGYFKIKSLPTGTHEVVASIIGYESLTKVLTVRDQNTYTLEFKLKETHYELESVEVKGATPDEWNSQLEIFKRRFLGESSFASECVITNPEIINFEWINSHTLRAEAGQPIIIINNALGYKIRCELVSFLWDTKSQRIRFTVRPSFAELKDTTGLLKEKWIKNRREVYYGSMDNFLKAAVNNSLTENGFQVYLDDTPSIEKKHLHHADNDLIRVIGNEFVMSFSDYLKIAFVLNDPVHPEVSWIKLVYPQVTLDKYGYPIQQLPFEVFGYWAGKGFADMLPKYYLP